MKRDIFRIFCSTATVVFAVAPSAFGVTDVWYNPTNAPIIGNSPANSFAVERIIMASLREWEANSHGRLQFNYRGMTTTPPCGLGGGRIVINWNPNETACARMILVGSCALGNLDLSPVPIQNAGDLTPALTGRCADLRATITHEIGHWARWDLVGNHPVDSVLNPLQSPDSDLLSRHVWNGDITSIHPYFNPAQPTIVGLDIYNATTGGVTNFGANTVVPSSYTAAISGGVNGNMYARVASPGYQALQVQQGDGFASNWSSPVQIWFNGTHRRACIATRPGKLVVLWTELSETSAVGVSGSALRFAGTRPIVCAMSTNGGTVWNLCSPSTGIVGARSRTGVSCGYDPTQDRVVLAYSDEEERLRIAHVPGSVSTTTQWSSPAILTNQSGIPIWASDLPELSFDPFSNDNRGVVTWFDGDELNPRAMWITYASATSTYVAWGSAMLPLLVNGFVQGAEANLMRTALVPNVISGQAHYSFARQQSSSETRHRYLPSGGTSVDALSNSGPPAVFEWYSGSAANSVLVETSYLRQGVSF